MRVHNVHARTHADTHQWSEVGITLSALFLLTESEPEYNLVQTNSSHLVSLRSSPPEGARREGGQTIERDLVGKTEGEKESRVFFVIGEAVCALPPPPPLPLTSLSQAHQLGFSASKACSVGITLRERSFPDKVETWTVGNNKKKKPCVEIKKSFH